MAKPTVRRITKLGIKVSLALCIPFYIFTVFAYLSLGKSMQSKDFDIFPSKKPPQSDPNDFFMKILKGTLIISLMASYIVNSIPLKAQIMAHFSMKDNDSTHVKLAALISLVTGTLAYVYPEITNWMSLLGALGANSLAVLLPSLCFYKAVRSKPEYALSLKLVIVWATLTTTASLACILATISDMVGYHPDW